MMNSRPTIRPDAPRGPFKGLRTGVTKLIGSKRFILVVSFLVAVLAWSALVASDGTLTRQKVFQNVAVSVTGEATLKSRGYIVMDDIGALLPGVKMTVEVTQQNYNRVSGTSYNPHIDLSKIQSQGHNTVEVGFSSQIYGPVVSCEPSSITVNVERYMTRRVPVVLEMNGEAPGGVYLDSYKTDPTMLSVSGPQSLVSSVSRAVAQLDLSALSSERMSDRTALAVVLQDASGQPVVSDKLEVTNQTVITDAIIVDTELVPLREVPIALDTLAAGEPAEGYEITGIVTPQEALAVAARKETLDGLEFLTTDQPLDVTGATQDVSGYVKLRRVTGAENTLPTEIAVTVKVSEKTVERTLHAVPLEIDGLGAGLSASLSNKQITVQLTGGYAFLSAIDKDSVRLFVDASGLEAGSHVLPVQIRIDNAQSFSCALSTPEVTVKIKEN